ncbi:MAG: DUF2779 domain-containing protein [Peptococcaceae bacterium]|nr:DUF2779 domain-containing protein [Peptococcaceae bacterium]
MVMQARYLTKSRFKQARECPTKLYYTGKSEYANQNIEDSFLLALADGGFQVGELAKYYFPGGYEIKTLDYEEALSATSELLKKDHVVIFEAAIRWQNLFIRADILIKNKDQLELVEVKAKSFAEACENIFWTKKGTLSSEWQSYLEDVAFQKYVLNQAYPEYSVSAYLMMADKSARCPTNGLNQKFKLTKDQDGRRSVIVSRNLSAEDLSPWILGKVNIDNCCRFIYTSIYEFDNRQLTFSELVNIFADYYNRDTKIIPILSLNCSTCEFRATEPELAAGLKSGYHECWQETLGWTDRDFAEPTVFDIWNCRKKQTFLSEGRLKLTEITEQDISPRSDDKPGLSTSERQWLQIKKTQTNDLTCWLDRANLSAEMQKWVYPLHFIDFETAMAAIPFYKGRHPYEGIAFQFSHHVVYADGRIEHHGQYLNTQPGVFPNYDFIRTLKKELELDQGSIFRYAAHENTYLNLIYQQLTEDPTPIVDREELCGFIRTVTQAVKGNSLQWTGHRNMIDMLELVKRFYYDPVTKGSNSIKHVLPAILNRSGFLQEKYSQPIYGAAGGIPSLNYQNWTWIAYEDGKVIDPYKLLPVMFQDVSQKDFTLLSDSDELRDGGAALTAYARLQFEEMSEYERSEIEKALLKYCELDTLAMVMIYEGWKVLIG